MRRALLVILAGVLAYVALEFYATFTHTSFGRSSAGVVHGSALCRLGTCQPR